MADAPKKLNTKDILAAARAEAAKARGESSAPASEATPAEPAAHAPAPVETPAAAPKPAAPKPAAAPGAKPKSTADILAALRAETARKAAGGESSAAADTPAPAAPKPAAKPAAEKPAAKAKPAAKPAPAAEAAGGSGLSVEEMLAAVRPTSSVAAVPAVVDAGKVEGKKAEKPVLPPMPQRPVPSKKPQPAPAPLPDSMRRGIILTIILSPFILVAKLFATPFAAAWTMLTATTGIAGLATARFMLPNVLTEPPRKFKIGPPTDYDLGTVATKWVAQYGIWVVHTDQYKSKNLVYALASVCTHLGCTPSWLEGEQKFKCPCHGSGFYITGINFEGPAPRPLERVGITIASDGMLEVDKSVKFQEEMGQWEDPNSYFEVVG